MSQPILNTIVQRKEALLATLRSLGVVRVVIEYSGGGDNGQVDSISAYTKDDKRPEDIDVLAARFAGPNEIPMKVSNKLLDLEDSALSVILEQFAYDAIEVSNLADWYNNEGGGGAMTLLVEDGEDSEGDLFEAGVLSIRHYYNTIKQNYEDAVL